MPPKGWKKSKDAAPAPEKKTRMKKTAEVAQVASGPVDAPMPAQASSVGEMHTVLHSTEVIITCLVSNRLALDNAKTDTTALAGRIDKAIANAVDHLDRLRSALPLGKAPLAAETASESVGTVREALAKGPEVKASQEAPKASAPVQAQAPAPVAQAPAPVAHTIPLQAPAPGVSAAPPVQAQAPFRPVTQ